MDKLTKAASYAHLTGYLPIGIKEGTRQQLKGTYLDLQQWSAKVVSVKDVVAEKLENLPFVRSVRRLEKDGWVIVKQRVKMVKGVMLRKGSYVKVWVHHDNKLSGDVTAAGGEQADAQAQAQEQTPVQTVIAKVDRAQVATMVEAILQKSTFKPDAKMVQDMVASGLEKLTAREVVVTRPDKTIKNVGKQHKQFKQLLSYLACELHVWMTGPAGSGKSHAAMSAADALGLAFYSEPISMQTGEHVFMGYKDANGVYQKTMFRDCYQKGGVFLLDEADRGNPNTLGKLNQAIANGQCAFPDKMVKIHKDFRLIAAANTYGRGGNRVYVGPVQQDAASLDRFVLIDWDYDEALEAEMAGHPEWVKFVQRARHAAADLGIRIVISPRASVSGAKLLKAGVGRQEVEDAVLWKGIGADEVGRIKSSIRNN